MFLSACHKELGSRDRLTSLAAWLQKWSSEKSSHFAADVRKKKRENQIMPSPHRVTSLVMAGPLAEASFQNLVSTTPRQPEAACRAEAVQEWFGGPLAA